MSGRSSRRTSNAGTLHRCQHYTVNAYVAASALNTGSVICPRIVAASTVHFGAGHPLNRTELLWPDEQGSMPDGSNMAPRTSIVSRRALLMALLSALISARDFYPSSRSATCLHINTSSTYLSQVWNQYLPDWEQNGWPSRSQDDDDEENDNDDAMSVVSNGLSIRPARSSVNLSGRARLLSSAASIAPSVMSAQSQAGDGLLFDDGTDKMIDDDLLRKVAVLRRQIIAPDAVGTVVVTHTVPSQNPADRLCREAARDASLNVGTRLTASPANKQRRRASSSGRRKSVPALSPSSTNEPLPTVARVAKPAATVERVVAAAPEPAPVKPVVAAVEPLRFVPKPTTTSPNKASLSQLLEEPDLVSSFDDARSGYMTCDDDFADARSRADADEHEHSDDESEYDDEEDEADSLDQPPTPEDGSVLYSKRTSSLSSWNGVTNGSSPKPAQNAFERRVHDALHQMDPHGMVSKQVNVLLVDDAVAGIQDPSSAKSSFDAPSPSSSSVSRFFSLGRQSSRSPSVSPALGRTMPLHDVSKSPMYTAPTAVLPQMTYRKASDASNVASDDYAVHATPAPTLRRRFSLFSFSFGGSDKNVIRT